MTHVLLLISKMALLTKITSIAFPAFSTISILHLKDVSLFLHVSCSRSSLRKVDWIKHSTIKPVHICLSYRFSHLTPLSYTYILWEPIWHEMLSFILSKFPTICEYTVPGSFMLQTSSSLLAHHTYSIFLLLRGEDDLTSSFRFSTALQLISVSTDQPCSSYLILKHLSTIFCA